MAYQVISSKQIFMAAIVVGACVTAGQQGVNFYMAQQDLPLVETKADGTCLRVVNFKNGDGYVCQDKDVVLRRYRTAIAKEQQ
jgi:hypothetical protein